MSLIHIIKTEGSSNRPACQVAQIWKIKIDIIAGKLIFTSLSQCISLYVGVYIPPEE